jgi:hypothetical protein
MKGVLLWCLTGVCVERKIALFYFIFVIDIYDYFSTYGPRKKM